MNKLRYFLVVIFIISSQYSTLAQSYYDELSENFTSSQNQPLEVILEMDSGQVTV